MIIKSKMNTYEVVGRRVTNLDSGLTIPEETKTYRRVIRYARGERTPSLERRFE